MVINLISVSVCTIAMNSHANVKCKLMYRYQVLILPSVSNATRCTIDIHVKHVQPTLFNNMYHYYETKEVNSNSIMYIR